MKKKLRLFLSTAKDVHRKFYWFEVNNSDLYWGTSADVKHAFCEIHTTSSNQFQIDTPKHFKELLEGRTKFSYHESGEFHIQILEDGVYGESKLRENWKIGEDPVIHLFSVLSKPIVNYPIHTQSVTKGGSMGRAILLEGDAGKDRILMEFFAVESIENQIPDPVLGFNKEYYNILHFPITTKLILCVRFVKFANLEDWHGDKELVILRQNKKYDLPY
jgi:hypothetical protein